MSDYIYNVPDFVANAKEDMLDVHARDAVVVGDRYRIDNRAAAWCSAAELQKQAAAGERVDPYAKQMVDEACQLFGIGEKDFALPELPMEHIIVKQASDVAEFFVADAQQLKDNVDVLMAKRADYPLAFCRECANKLLDCAYAHDYDLPKEDEVALLRMGGTAHFNKEAAAREIEKRGDYAKNHGSDSYASLLYKLANQCLQMAENGSCLLSNAVTDTVDSFDREFGLVHKLASAGLDFIEKAAYMTADEALSKSASEPVEIDDEHSIPRSRLMVEDTRQQMVKWASMQGYSTTDEAKDIVDCVSAMPSSLRAEFCEIFA